MGLLPTLSDSISHFCVIQPATKLSHFKVIQSWSNNTKTADLIA
jgi:hypothetical protein